MMKSDKQELFTPTSLVITDDGGASASSTSVRLEKRKFIFLDLMYGR